MKKTNLLLVILPLILLFSCAVVKSKNMNSNEIGLSVLGWVKKTLGNKVDIKSLNQYTKGATMEHRDWDTLCRKHVTINGKVDYRGIANDSALLYQYLDDVSNHPPSGNWTKEEKLAYWINAYNAFTVKLILDHYPLMSIKDISNGLPMINSPWDIKFFRIGDIRFDLNTIEHEILRKEFDEPRIHFAINCASVSCPRLRNEAFIADQLEAQLEDQATSFIHNADKNLITNVETKLSKIFSWFTNDFTQQEGLLEYIKKYHPELNPDIKIEYLQYDWSLNH